MTAAIAGFRRETVRGVSAEQFRAAEVRRELEICN
jgi:hypothetical protein